MNPILEPGAPAPPFSALSDEGDTWTLAALAGRRAVIYFYPRDNTPGCTEQACDLRDNLGQLKALGLIILGVSPDTLKSHAGFRHKHALNFPLLSDPEQAMAQAFGVWREKVNYGRTYLGIVRSTFVVDAEGVIERVYDNVRAKGHAARLLKDLGA